MAQTGQNACFWLTLDKIRLSTAKNVVPSSFIRIRVDVPVLISFVLFALMIVKCCFPLIYFCSLVTRLRKLQKKVWCGCSSINSGVKLEKPKSIKQLFIVGVIQFKNRDKAYELIFIQRLQYATGSTQKRS